MPAASFRFRLKFHDVLAAHGLYLDNDQAEGQHKQEKRDGAGDLHVNIENTISQAVLAKLGGDFKNQLAVINVGQVNISSAKSTAENLVRILEEMPEPRLENLMRLAISVVVDLCGEEQAAVFLGTGDRGDYPMRQVGG